MDAVYDQNPSINIIYDGFASMNNWYEHLYKYQNLCETDDPINFKEKIDKKYLNLSEIDNRIKKGLDIIGRDDFFIRVDVDDTYPKYLLNSWTLEISPILPGVAVSENPLNHHIKSLMLNSPIDNESSIILHRRYLPE